MAELPRYEAQIKQTQADVPPAIQGVRAATAGQVMLEQNLTDKLSNFFETSRQIAEPILAKKAEKAAIAEFRAAGDKEVKDIGLMESYGFTAYRDAYNKRLHELTIVRAKNDIKRHADKLERDYEDDPVGYKNAFDSFASSYIDKVPAYLKPIAYEYTETLKTSSMDAVAKKHIEKMKQIELAETNDFLRDTMISATNAAYRNDNESAARFRIEHFSKIDEQIEDNIITPEQGRQAKEKFDSAVRENVFVSAMDRMVDSGYLDNAAQYLSDFEEGTYEDFSTFERDAIAAKMRQRLKSALAIKKAEEDAMFKNADIEIKDATKVFNSGKFPSNFDTASMMYDHASLTNQHEFDVARSAYSITSNLSDRTLPEQMAIVNSMEQGEVESRVGMEAIKQAKQNLKEKMSLAEKDPISLSVQDGVNKSITPVTPSNIMSNPALLVGRAKQAQIASLHYGVRPKLFTEPEVQQFSAWLEDPSTSIESKMQFVETVEGSIGQYGKEVYNQLMEKRAYTLAGAGAMRRAGYRDRAMMILQGDMILRTAGKEIDHEAIDTAIINNFGNALTVVNNEHERNKIRSSVKAYYASLSEGYATGIGTTMDVEDAAKTAIEDIMGKASEKPRNGLTFFAPFGKEPQDVEDYFDEIDTNIVPDLEVIPRESIRSALKRSQFIHLGGGKYAFKFNNKVIRTAEKEPLILEYR